MSAFNKEELEILIQSLEESYKRSLECLNSNRSALAVAKLVKDQTGIPFTKEEHQVFVNNIEEAFDIAEKSLQTLNSMRRISDLIG